MFLSVILPMLNAEPFLARCLESLLAQDYPATDFEILLVDNGSSDGSLAIARGYERVTLMHEPRRGAYSARNHAIRAARGDLCVFTDPDCVADRSWLRQLAVAMEDPALGVVCGRRLPPNSSLLLGLVNDYENTKDRFVLDGNNSEIHYGYSSNMIVRRELFERLGLFRELPRGADTLFVREVSRALGPAAVAYRDNARITHLEVDGIGVYYKKVFLYARHRRLNNEILRSRPLRTTERMAIFRQTVRERNYTPLRAATLLALLALGSACWALGHTRAWRAAHNRTSSDPPRDSSIA